MTRSPSPVAFPLVATLLIVTCPHAPSAPPPSNYDESKVAAYTLPDPLVCADGTPVRDAATWRSKRRPEILRLLSELEYGSMPPPPERLRFDPPRVEANALGGIAIRKQVRIHFSDRPGGPSMDLLIYIPKKRLGPAPAFLGLNFYGNHSTHPDAGIDLNTNWMRNNKEFGVVDNRATEASRGVRASRWPVERIVARGYALATAYYGDIAPDQFDDFKSGVFPLWQKPGDATRAPDAPGAITAWAWGLSRTMDYLQTDPDIDAENVAVMGHSRLGKTALWAGATDERFAIVISNNSGCGGAALHRRDFGEQIRHITRAFPHWFCPAFSAYVDREAELPFDQHMLIALAAPRPVYVASAEQDRWADPRGEFLAAKAAGPVYRLLGTEGLPATDMPAINSPSAGTIGYHVRDGAHDVTDYDWDRYMDFADKHRRAGAAPARGPATAIYRARFLPKAMIQIDGRLDEPNWARTDALTSMRFPWKSDPPPRTEFRALCDEQNLYFSFDIDDADIVALENFSEEADAVLEDRAEIYFSLDDRMARYFCAEIDSRGRALDYSATHYRQFDRKWNLDGLSAAGRLRPGGYAVEGLMPHKSLEALGFPRLKPGTKIRWGIFRAEFSHDRSGKSAPAAPSIHNLGRTGQGPPPIENWISWVDPGTTEPDFHVPSSLGWLEVVE